MISWRVKPQVIRCDNGTQYSSAAIQNWTVEWGLGFNTFSLATPQQNGYVGRFNRTVRYELLSQYIWPTFEEVQDFATRGMWSNSNDCPNIALGGFTPNQKLSIAA